MTSWYQFKDWVLDEYCRIRAGKSRLEWEARKALIAKQLQIGIHELMQKEFANYEGQPPKRIAQ